MKYGEIYSESDKKIELYKELVNDIKACNCCENIKVPIFNPEGECLMNDDSRTEVNLWNCWQGSLDAKIMVIGQDFGRLVSREETENTNNKYTAEQFRTGEVWHKILNKEDRKSKWVKTDYALYDRLKEVDECLDLTKPQKDLFFTNMAVCYRKNKDQSGESSAWLNICSSKFMSRLINIIEPDIIVTLGMKTFEALQYCEDMTLICTEDLKGNKENTFANIINYNYELERKNNNSIDVFPVFHAGANANRNRTEEQQKEDWKKIRQKYKDVR